MKASELKPGQFFEFIGTRYMVVGIDKNSPHLLCCVCQEGSKFRITWIIAQNEVTPLAVTGWEDEPPVAKPVREVYTNRSPSNTEWINARGLAQHFNLAAESEDYDECYKVAQRIHSLVVHQMPEGFKRYSDTGERVHAEKYKGEPVAKPEPEPIPFTNAITGEKGQFTFASEEVRQQFIEDWKPEPEQFAAGDWLYCIESHAGIVKGRVYKVLAVKRDGWPEVEEGQGYWNPKYFRRATADEVADQQRKDYWQHPVAANKPDADGWIEHDGNGCPVDGDTLIEVRCANGATEKGLAKEWVAGWNSNKWRFDITHYRLVNPPTPELTWTVTT